MIKIDSALWTRERPTKDGIYLIITEVVGEHPTCAEIVLKDDDASLIGVWVVAFDDYLRLDEVEWFLGPIEVDKPKEVQDAAS